MMRLIIAAVLCAICKEAAAAPQCAPRDDVMVTLATKYGEAPQSMGRAQDGTLMELYAGEAGTWTLTVTLPDGVTTCLVAAGTGFVTVKPGEPA